MRVCAYALNVLLSVEYLQVRHLHKQFGVQMALRLLCILDGE